MSIDLKILLKLYLRECSGCFANDITLHIKLEQKNTKINTKAHRSDKNNFGKLKKYHCSFFRNNLIKRVM